MNADWTQKQATNMKEIHGGGWVIEGGWMGVKLQNKSTKENGMAQLEREGLRKIWLNGVNEILKRRNEK